jgi:hypothetical protein
MRVVISKRVAFESMQISERRLFQQRGEQVWRLVKAETLLPYSRDNKEDQDDCGEHKGEENTRAKYKGSIMGLGRWLSSNL